MAFTGAFHGRTLGALSLNRSKAVHRQGFPELAGVIEAPFCEDRRCSVATCSCGFFPKSTSEKAWLWELLDPDGGRVDPGEVAYIIVEPIQGEGGYRIPSNAFMDELATVCTEYEIPLIADEVQTGIGRTGEWWGADHYAINPDVIASAKALGVGATISSDEFFPEEPGRISSTWGGGDILASMRGVLTIDVIREQDLLTNATTRGEQFKELLREADPEYVEDVRGRGLLLAVEFDSQTRRDCVVQAAFERGLLTLGAGFKTLRVLPPLDVTKREIAL